jgi:hypothetical protein
MLCKCGALLVKQGLVKEKKVCIYCDLGIKKK